MKVDYIIVGQGLAGVNFCYLLLQHSKSFVVFDDNSQQSSTVAGGLYNPVVLKRFTPVWKSDEQLELVNHIYNDLASYLETTLDYKLPVKRLFNSVEEQNNWFVAADKYGLQKYLSPKICNNNNMAVPAPYGLGEVLHTGRIDTEHLLATFKKKLASTYINESFNYDDLIIKEDAVIYKDIQAKNIVFCEGFGLKKNPYFNHLPLNGTKGELLTIHAPDLKIDFVLKSSAFLIPLGNDYYTVGATYNWTDKTNQPSAEGKKELLEKLKTFIKCDFKVVNQKAGIRPTVKDRRPLVGQHPKYDNLYVLNGLGTRGVMIAPYVAKQLYNFIENAIKLEEDINITRFSS
ncbi:NAD(P)/FAD-dependent oxidoreductase [Mangrovimonas spongiae]|uniref:FAD-dependent oxidoreductase n=1 Tax=Mangrovimonas spongiae TaxID=2494697 RepID=A0A428K0K3_9FLAO|nr:FAD-dependent oxidoreductase [Mangrovimonas spongiae]RSK39960.1 FAD-dependent oxidoreductase [Mangrovimonas spongiae]